MCCLHVQQKLVFFCVCFSLFPDLYPSCIRCCSIVASAHLCMKMQLRFYLSNFMHIGIRSTVANQHGDCSPIAACVTSLKNAACIHVTHAFMTDNAQHAILTCNTFPPQLAAMQALYGIWLLGVNMVLAMYYIFLGPCRCLEALTLGPKEPVSFKG